MPIDVNGRTVNTTNYEHSTEPNLNDLHKAMEYDSDGKPRLRVTSNIQGDIVIEGSVTIPGTVNVESSPENPVHVHVIESVPIVISRSGTPNDVGNPIYVNIGDTGTVSVSGPIEIKNDIDNPIPISKDLSVNSTTNRIYVSMETDAVVADSNYYMNVARGLVTGQYSVQRSAYMPATPNTETSIWVEGGIYPHATWTSASVIYVASSSAADTAQSITIEGLDSSYNLVTAQVTTNGTTTVSTTQTFIRIYTATITGGSVNAGDIRFRITSASGTVVAHIGPNLGVTKLSQYTVPAGYKAYIQYGDVSTFKNGAGNQSGLVKMMVRPFNGTFIAAFIAQVSNGYYRNDFTVPLLVPEKADIDVRILTDATGASVSSNYQMILIPN